MFCFLILLSYSQWLLLTPVLASELEPWVCSPDVPLSELHWLLIAQLNLSTYNKISLSAQTVKDIFNPKIGYDFGGREEKYTEMN